MEGTRSSAEDSLEDAPLFRSFSSCSPRYRKVHGKDNAMRHSISRCESSDNSDNLSFSSQSPNSLGSSPSFGANNTGPSKLSMSPELRRPHQIEALTRAENTKSCPELEEMLASSGMKMPTTVGGANACSTPTRESSRHSMSIPSPLVTQSSSDSGVSAKSTTLVNRSVSATESSQTDSDDVSPQVHRRRRHQLHPKEPLPKFSISLEEAEAYSVRALRDRACLSAGNTAPVSLPCLVSPNPRLSVEPEIPSPLVQAERSRSGGLVKSSSTSGLSLIIPGDHPEGAVGGGSSNSSGIGGVSPNLSQSV